MVRTYLRLQSLQVGAETRGADTDSNNHCEQHFKVLPGKRIVVYEWSKVVDQDRGQYQRWKAEISFDSIVRLNLLPATASSSIFLVQVSQPPKLFGGDQYWCADKQKRAACQWVALDAADPLSKLLETYCYHKVIVGNRLEKVANQIKHIKLPQDATFTSDSLPAIDLQTFSALPKKKKFGNARYIGEGDYSSSRSSMNTPVNIPKKKMRYNGVSKENIFTDLNHTQQDTYPPIEDGSSKILRCSELGVANARRLLSVMSKYELEQQVRVRGLKTTGNKQQLLERILDCDFKLSPLPMHEPVSREAALESSCSENPTPTFSTPMAFPAFASIKNENVDLLSPKENFLTPHKGWTNVNYLPVPKRVVVSMLASEESDDFENVVESSKLYNITLARDTDAECEKISFHEAKDISDTLLINSYFKVSYRGGNPGGTTKEHFFWLQSKIGFVVRLPKHSGLFVSTSENVWKSSCPICGLCAETFPWDRKCNPLECWMHKNARYDVRNLLSTRIPMESRLDHEKDTMLICQNGHLVIQFFEMDNDGIDRANRNDNCCIM